MSIKCEEYSQVCVMEAQGDFTADDAAAAKKSMEDYIDHRRIIDFVVDFQKCGFIDSEGLESLLWMKRRSEDLFGQIKLVNLDENCRKILQITRLDHRFEMHGDLASALKTMR
jgi:anti-sigma B factor antagonist